MGKQRASSAFRALSVVSVGLRANAHTQAARCVLRGYCVLRARAFAHWGGIKNIENETFSETL